MPLRLVVPAHWTDDDPTPRPAEVGPWSAYAAVPVAKPLPAGAVRVVADPGPMPKRRLRALRSWRFGTTGAGPDHVTVPDCWSRRDPVLADHRGPAHYERTVRSEAPRARLVFDQLDYVAEVLLDGAFAGFHEGGFTPVAVDLPTGRDVVVAVVLDDPVEPELFVPMPLLAPKRKVKGVQEWHDSRPGGMQVAPDFDERWVTRWGTGGITGPVQLWETGDVRIDATFVTAAPGELRVSWVLTNLRAEAADIEVTGRIDRAAVTATATIPPGAHRIAIRLDVTGERHWNVGEPALYRLASAVTVDGEASDADDVPVGFRRVDLPTSGPQQFRLTVNGRRTYVRAANYIPGVWSPELTPEMLERDVALARAANLNSLGVHAGVCTPLLPATDAAGIAVYQDFPLQWGYDPAGPALSPYGTGFAETSMQLAAELVYHLYNHPSVVYWCGHNEPGYQLAEAFEHVQSPELRGLAELMAGYPNENALDERRADLFRHVDPTRPATAASGLGASRDAGDVHDYTGSLGGGSATRAGTAAHAFVSEYGAWSANFSAAERAPGARGDWPPPAGIERDWHARTHLFAVQSTYAGRPDRFEDFPTWCFAGQLWAGWHAKVVTERARLNRFAPSAGARWHFLVDHWGDGGAGVVDRHRTTGPAFRGLAAANRPVVALAPFPDGARVPPGTLLRLPVVVVNDSQEDRPGLTLRWRLAALGPDDAFLVGRDTPLVPGPLQTELAPPDQVCVLPRRPGETLLDGEVEVRAAADSAATVAEISWSSVEGPVALFLDLDGVVGWTSWMVAPDGWSPVPGLTGPSRFRVTADRAAALRRRWTGEEVDPAAAPPDQYLLGDLAVDVYDDTHVTSAGDVETNPLPWPVTVRG